jgi:hypothetical protein
MKEIMIYYRMFGVTRWPVVLKKRFKKGWQQANKRET